MQQKNEKAELKGEYVTNAAVSSASGKETEPSPAIPAKTPVIIPGASISSLAMLRRCLSYFKPYKMHIFMAVVGMLMAALAEGAAAWLVQPAMDDIFLKKDRTALVLVPVALIIVTCFKGGGRLTQNYMMQFCGLNVLEKLRDALYTKVIKLPVKFYEGAQVGMLMSRIINDVASIRSSLPALVMAIRQVITMIVLLGVAFYANAKLAAISLFVLPLAFYPFIYFGKKLRRLGRKNYDKLSDISVYLQEVLSGIRIVKAFSAEDIERERFEVENRRLVKINLKQCLAGELSSASMEIVGALGISIVLYFGGLQVINNEITPGAFFSFVASVALLYDPVKKLSAASNDIQRALAGADRVFEMLDSADILEEASGDVELVGPIREISFDNVMFAYAEDPVLRDINLTVHAGERIALVGPSGAGKTTLVNMIARFYDPTQGCVRINGVDLREYSLPSLRKQVAIVSQDSFLFNYSVKENIAYAQSGLDQSAIEEAAKAAYAHNFVMEMPEKYETVVGERGVKLSGGQKQRLTIARAIARNAPLLILDEATSALDSESEKIVQQALENLMQNRTSFVIAHRLSTVLSADRILVMENGRIVDIGKHDELLARCALYAKLYAMQFNS